VKKIIKKLGGRQMERGHPKGVNMARPLCPNEWKPRGGGEAAFSPSSILSFQQQLVLVSHMIRNKAEWTHKGLNLNS
jgi:hypothetical protein